MAGFPPPDAALKCQGLTADQLVTGPPRRPTLSLLGLVRHMAAVERGWFRRLFNGQAAAFLFSSDADPDGDSTSRHG